MTDIIRKRLYNRDMYDRISKETFDKAYEMSMNEEIVKEYEKWLQGINYKTGRKINKNGLLYKKLGYKFEVHGWLFTKYLNYNVEEYLNESIKLRKDINEYNNKKDEINNKIDMLEDWNDYVEFQGEKYGMYKKIKNNIHLENNCRGNMVLIDTCKEYHMSNCRPFATHMHTTDRIVTRCKYKCDKCDYKYET